MKYEEAVAYMDRLTLLGWQPGLERFAEFCRRLGDPQDRFKSVHVAGTNGKGSTTAMIASILQAAGYRTGMYISPYVYDMRERVQVDGRMIPKEDFARLVESIIPCADELADTDLGHPTEFEVKTAVAFLYFAEREVDFAVLEVGLGGRLDATNIVTPMVGVITSIGLDHTDRLGTTIPEIAFEKAGIVKSDGQLVTAVTDPEAFDVIRRVCEDRNSALWQVAPTDDTGARFAVRSIGAGDTPFESRPLPPRRRPTLTVDGLSSAYSGLVVGMQGEFQYVNAATAVGAVDALIARGTEVPEEAVRAGLRDACMPGRLEVIRRNPTIVLDGAHNPSAATALLSAVRAQFEYDRLILVMGMVKGHAVEDVVAVLAPVADILIATASSSSRAVPAESVAEAALPHASNVEVVETVPAAVHRALELAGHRDLVLVTGSFYVVGEVPRSSLEVTDSPHRGHM